MKVIRLGEAQTDTYAGQTVSGILVDFYAAAKANNQVLDNSDFQFRNTSVSLTYMKQGEVKARTLLSCTYDVLLNLCNYEREPYKARWGNTGISANSIPLFLVGESADSTLQKYNPVQKDIRLIQARLIFPTPINLMSGDKLDLTLNFSPGTCNSSAAAYPGATANADDTASYFQISQVVGHGVGHGIPMYDILAIQQNQANVNVPCGDSVQSVFFINTDRVDSTIVNSVIQNMTIQSASKSETLQYNEMLGMRSNQLHDWSDLRYANFLLFHHQLHNHYVNSVFENVTNGVNISLNLNTPNVTASNNYVVTISIQSDLMQNKHVIASGAMHHANTMHALGLYTDAHHAAQRQTFQPFIRGRN